MNNKLLEKLKKNSTIKETDVLSDSTIFNETELVSTPVPAVNIALSGSVNGGFSSGLYIFAGPSKNFKTNFLLLMLKAYLDKYEDAVAIFYDTEFGANKSYFESFGIDTSRVIHTPLSDIEQLKFDVMKQLDDIKRGDKVFIAIDSIGNIASKKEVEDALEGSSKADMSRAKQLKSLFRMVTPHLTLKQLPMVVVNHTYQTQELYSKTIVSGGNGAYYSASSIFILGRQQEKDGTEVTGYNFIINVEKSRTVREKSKIPVQVLHNLGINKWSGLLDIALETKHIVKPSNGWYSKVDLVTGEIESKKYRLDDTMNADFWNSLINDENFKSAVEKMYKVSSGNMLESVVTVNEV